MYHCYGANITAPSRIRKDFVGGRVCGGCTSNRTITHHVPSESGQLIHVETNNFDRIVVLMIRGEPRLMSPLHIAKNIVVECPDGWKVWDREVQLHVEV
jgi:hypothetical protein